MSDSATFDADVAIVGYGPVGQALAALLGRAGHEVVVIERFEHAYPLPRAVHLDHEIMRLLQTLGLAEDLAREMLAVRDYQWYGADGDPILTITPQVPSASGWEPDYMFFQPDLEAALDVRAQAEPTIDVQRGWIAEQVEQHEDHVELRLRGTTSGEERTVCARWVVGADGANSIVREAAGITRRDLGFQEQWLVVDVEPHDIEALDLPPAIQWCDPRRPATHIRSGTRHRRWEFMLLPGERPDQLEDEQRVWELLSPWFTPQDGVLTRATVYEFRSMLADTMRERRVLLAGDAAHLTPPFMGQGLCSGLRDAVNIAWKLDLVLRGIAGEALLDSIDPERQPQNEWIITVAVELGKVLCQLDPVAAAERDAVLRDAGDPPPLEFAPLTGGAIRHDVDGAPGPLAGRLSVQGRVRAAVGDALLDDVTGGGFVLVAACDDPRAALDQAQAATLDALAVTLVALDSTADADGALTAWLAEHEAHAVLVRPDFYVFGSAATAADLPALVDDLSQRLNLSLSQSIPAT